LKCPVCFVWSFRLETRVQPDNTVKRTSECANGHRWISVERVERLLKTTGKTLKTKG